MPEAHFPRTFLLGSSVNKTFDGCAEFGPMATYPSLKGLAQGGVLWRRTLLGGAGWLAWWPE
jgi:hypothetical protein